ncbi:nucleotide sugar dehydrogenase [Amniculicola lignicola CBS 123094]|uniref:Nucleotide sugar dehydrogenase n=1 Tax=Amniculicola lignicola CBS 123094 TaxID=1392246 RepID=A0A6A5WCY7_9PLEO|nr:nucleotide sugar dehydrogenase [Amniculicola lignicola CBS 123094]
MALKLERRPPHGSELNIFLQENCYAQRKDLPPSSFGAPPTPPADEYSKIEYSLNQAFEHKPVGINETPQIAVIGVGYVGAHLISSFASHYDVVGFDISEARIQDMRKQHIDNDRISFTCQAQDLRTATHFLISVPTLLRPDKTIDSTYLQSALDTVGNYGRPGATVVFESSVAVGMTRQLLGPLGAARNLFVGMSPERVDPGRTEPPVRSIPKIVSGLDDIIPGSLQSILRLYTPVFDTVVAVSKPEVAEMMKLYENCQRMIGIAYANEMADACIPHGIDPYEVCSVAATKPFGYTPFTPSLGVGGHCIPVNPYYLLSNNEFPLLQTATEKMWQRPSIIAQRVLNTLRQDRRKIGFGRKPRVLVVGLGFKRGQSQLSNSPGIELAKSLSVSNKVHLWFADPLVKQEAVPQILRLDDSDWVEEVLGSFNMIIVAIKQVGLNFGILDNLKGVRIESWY